MAISSTSFYYAEGLKMEPIGVLKSDQFHTVSLHLTEMFVGKDMKVILLYIA